MLVGGSELIDNIRRSPYDVLSTIEARDEVRTRRAKRRAHTRGDHRRDAEVVA
jgi:hypothetical protein